MAPDPNTFPKTHLGTPESLGDNLFVISYEYKFPNLGDVLDQNCNKATRALHTCANCTAGLELGLHLLVRMAPEFCFSACYSVLREDSSGLKILAAATIFSKSTGLPFSSAAPGNLSPTPLLDCPTPSAKGHSEQCDGVCPFPSVGAQDRGVSPLFQLITPRGHVDRLFCPLQLMMQLMVFMPASFCIFASTPLGHILFGDYCLAKE